MEEIKIPKFKLQNYDYMKRKDLLTLFYSLLKKQFNNVLNIDNDYKIKYEPFNNNLHQINVKEILEQQKMFFIPISIKTPKHHHAMLLIIHPNCIIDSKYKIEIFDPMGYGKKQHNYIKKFIKQYFQGDYVIIDSPKYSFQYYEKKERHTPPHYKGLCGFWVLWYIYYRSINISFNRKELNEYALCHIKEVGFTNYIDSFVAFLQTILTI